MRILISGASGFVGRELTSSLQKSGHEVVTLVRRKSETTPSSVQKKEILWDPYKRIEDARPYENFEGVIHLSGESIAGGRWTSSFKKKILESRTITTKHFTEIFERVEKKPRVFVCASAIGYYDDHGGEEITESFPNGSEKDFLPSVCKQWELAASSLPKEIRKVHGRIGIILHPEGGALQKMLLPFKLFLGAPLGSGSQWMSWVSLRDICRMFEFCCSIQSLHGAVNFVGPEAATNRDFSKTLARVLNRPLLPAVPGFVLKALMGEMAEELLLQSRRVVPEALKKAGFHFLDSNLEDLLRSYLCQK